MLHASSIMQLKGKAKCHINITVDCLIQYPFMTLRLVYARLIASILLELVRKS